MPGTAPSPRPPSRPPHRRRERRPRRAAVGVVTAALLLPLVSALPPGAPGDAAAGGRDALRSAFTEAAGRHGVPENVLLGVAYLQSRWDQHGGRPSVSGGYGPMHLTDARTALARSRPHHGNGTEDPRGDTARPHRTGPRPVPDARRPPVRLRTLERAARLTGLPPERLRGDAAANVHGGAALLAAAQRELGRPLSADAADWYGAVAAYTGAAEEGGGTFFADEVVALLRRGAARTTDTGQRVVLPASPGLRPVRGERAGAARESTAAECPSDLSCSWVPAPYEEFRGDDGSPDYGNHDQAERPAGQRIRYIVVHDIEGSYESALSLVQDPTYVSWHYTLRASDGHIAQHVRTEDVAWHAGNWFVNSTSVGLEHEGFLTDPDAWYTEAMYRSSARLVRHLAEQNDIPLDRHHVLGHDNVPGVTTAAIRGMHTDPGPYWDWAHYFELLGAPFTPAERTGSDTGLVTIRPDYATHRPVFTRCDGTGARCPAHGSGAVRLHTAPRADAPLVRDVGLHPDGGHATDGVSDIGARASTGQTYAVAGREGDWTAIWYLGAKAWFHDPASRPAAVPARGTAVTPRAGADSVPVYGRAYPQADAYPDGVPPQEVSPLPYRLRAGQRYAAGPRVPSEYYVARTFDPSGHVVVRGEPYRQIQFGHRTAFVRAADVRLVEAGER
ncbi:N-acetylmuramoyl-L-alanine amidase [Streptomyces chumphonensis]|uniref:N-acetylmuramoyl-L-alanine amidase n=1 Tax=Streptomyces chumphonensis TaxID=1214925 RepID=A0A927EVW6_9ACTN|nr:N-acetylmuramoyl-L-alanine amidase [Streptomyces chumphonensis]